MKAPQCARAAAGTAALFIALTLAVGLLRPLAPGAGVAVQDVAGAAVQDVAAVERRLEASRCARDLGYKGEGPHCHWSRGAEVRRHCRPVMAMLKKEVQTLGMGLIITGQGGSMTRSAMMAVREVGTHDIGRVTHTMDSVSAVISDLGGRCPGPSEGHLLKLTKGSVYQLGRLPGAVCHRKRLNVCEVLMRQSFMRPSPAQRPWAIKAPRMREMLPFVDNLLGVGNYKLVHVTRDIRSIHKPHGMDNVDVLGLSYARADTIRFLLRRSHRGAWYYTNSELRRRILFVFAWARMEAELYKHWKTNLPRNYFQLSERDMMNQRTGVDKAMDLQRFLGASSSKKVASRMRNHYKPAPRTAAQLRLWNLTDAIVRLPGMETSLRALRLLGYPT